MISSLWRAGVVVSACAISGCALPLVAGITLNEASTVGSAISTLATGKGLGDHALDLATGYDCRVLEGVLSKDRHICEKPGSPKTAGDFHGLSDLASAPPADNRPSTQQHSMGPVAIALADRNIDKSAKKKTTQVAAARPAPVSAARPVSAAAAYPIPVATYPAPAVGAYPKASALQYSYAAPTAPTAVSVAAMPAGYDGTAPATSISAFLPQYY